MKNIIAALSIVTLVSIGLISLSQTSGTPGHPNRGADVAGCTMCIESLVAAIHAGVGEIITGGQSGSDLARQVVIIIGVPSERAAALSADFNACCVENGCDAMIVAR